MSSAPVRVSRPVAPWEVSAVLGLEAARLVQLDVAEAVASSPSSVEDLALVYEDGVLEAFVMDGVEAGLGHPGFLVAEFEVGRGFARCLVCGRTNATDPRPWCRSWCRDQLRRIGRDRWPDLDDRRRLVAATSWASAERRSDRGWHLPLSEVMEAMIRRGEL